MEGTRVRDVLIRLPLAHSFASLSSKVNILLHEML